MFNVRKIFTNLLDLFLYIIITILLYSGLYLWGEQGTPPVPSLLCAIMRAQTVL